MNKQKWIVAVVTLALIGAGAGVLVRLKSNQKLGAPGVKTSPLSDSKNLHVDLPMNLPGYEAEEIETQEIVIETLPKDTSFGQAHYKSEDGFAAAINVVLMGADRTSLHKPEFCLEGSGWHIDSKETTSVPISRPVAYELPVRKFTTTRDFVHEGQPIRVRGIYVFWFVADDRVAANHWERMWDMAVGMLRTGVLQRWAYVTYFTTCMPGQEEAAYKRLQEFIALSVPEFQLTPEAPSSQRAEAVASASQ